MAVATIDQIITDVKKVLPIYDNEDGLYNDQLQIIVHGAVHKLEIEGIPNEFDYQTSAYYDYITCVRYQVAQDMDLDVDIERLKAQYITRANTLRCSLNQSQS